MNVALFEKKLNNVVFFIAIFFTFVNNAKDPIIIYKENVYNKIFLIKTNSIFPWINLYFTLLKIARNKGYDKCVTFQIDGTKCLKSTKYANSCNHFLLGSRYVKT